MLPAISPSAITLRTRMRTVSEGRRQLNSRVRAFPVAVSGSAIGEGIARAIERFDA